MAAERAATPRAGDTQPLWGSLASQGSAWFNSQLTFKSNDRRRIDNPIGGIWPNAAQAIGAAISPVKLPIPLDAGTGAAEHFPAVGADVGGSWGAMAMKPDATVMTHSLESAVNSSRL
jgi:hypothetical protein